MYVIYIYLILINWFDGTEKKNVKFNFQNNSMWLKWHCGGNVSEKSQKCVQNCVDSVYTHSLS